ncbi:MAG: hypothetical protein IKZ74_06670 [Clostridiales bacterium]|nr:hypothetical protein [Clostridiales bacterium]
MNSKKNKYIAKVCFDKDEIDYLEHMHRPGSLMLWNVLAKKRALAIWLLAPDFKKNDTFSFNVTDDDLKFEGECDIHVGDVLKLSPSLPENKLKDIEIIAIKKEKPIHVKWDHTPAYTVEEAMKTANDLKIERSTFRLHGLPYVKDKNKKIVITSDKGNAREFPYETNKVFYLDEKRFFMLLEMHGEPMLAVSAYLTKNGQKMYRMKMSYWPDALNYFFVADSELSDFEGNCYKFKIEKGK